MITIKHSSFNSYKTLFKRIWMNEITIPNKCNSIFFNYLFNVLRVWLLLESTWIVFIKLEKSNDIKKDK